MFVILRSASFARRRASPARSREAAQECSPWRKPWDNTRKSDQARRGERPNERTFIVILRSATLGDEGPERAALLPRRILRGSTARLARFLISGPRSDLGAPPSRQAAQECSPWRKPWDNTRKSDQAPKGRKTERVGKRGAPPAQTEGCPILSRFVRKGGQHGRLSS
jgi:hypothetical protein